MLQFSDPLSTQKEVVGAVCFSHTCYINSFLEEYYNCILLLNNERREDPENADVPV